MKVLQWLLVIGVLLALPAALFLLMGDLDRVEEFGGPGPEPGPPSYIDCPPSIPGNFIGPTVFGPDWPVWWLPLGVLPVILCGLGWRERAAGRRRGARRFGMGGALSAVALAVGIAIVEEGWRAHIVIDYRSDLFLRMAVGGVPGLVLGLVLLAESRPVPEAGLEAPR